MKRSEIGVLGLGVMGKSLSSNLLSKGFRVSVFNREVAGVEENIARHFVENSGDENVLGYSDFKNFVQSIQSPRVILIMVNSGKAIDEVIDSINPYLSKGDCLIDGGNSYYKDTNRRILKLNEKGILFLGLGVSGGKMGALKGPSLMPGGSTEAYQMACKYLETIAAKDDKEKPCCQYLGEEGSGHFVKMVHNGIEYAEMQLIAEIYDILRYGLNCSLDEIKRILKTWLNQGSRSYLLEITIDILTKKEDGKILLDEILDKAAQKGTGSWSVKEAMDLGVPVPTINEAVSARLISSKKDTREKAYLSYESQVKSIFLPSDRQEVLNNVKGAYDAARMINHHIGFSLLKEASIIYSWDLNLSEIARIWTNGCIIKSELMKRISESFKNQDEDLLLHLDFNEALKNDISASRKIVSISVLNGIAVPVLSAAVNYFSGYITKDSNANLIQAQRDYFGAHGFQKIDKPEDEKFHFNWKL